MTLFEAAYKLKVYLSKILQVVCPGKRFIVEKNRTWQRKNEYTIAFYKRVDVTLEVHSNGYAMMK